MYIRENSVNLWECRVTVAPAEKTPAHDREQFERVPLELRQADRLPYQEISLTAKPDGWEIRVFGGNGGGSVTLFVPANSRRKVRVTDTSRWTWRDSLHQRLKRWLRVKPEEHS